MQRRPRVHPQAFGHVERRGAEQQRGRGVLSSHYLFGFLPKLCCLQHPNRRAKLP